jgi:hypothetical protein
METKKTQRIAPLLALALAGSAATAQAAVYAGGVYSKGPTPGMIDLANPANSDGFRAGGGRVYIHAIGWDRTSDADRKKIKGLFSSAPLFEAGWGSGPLSAPNKIKALLLPYYAGGSWACNINGLADQSTPNVNEMMANMKGKATRVAPVFSPNTGQWSANPWSSTRWNQTRSNAITGTALATDSPPSFYFSQPAGYQNFVAAEINWANAQSNVVSICIVHPHKSVDFFTDTKKYIGSLDGKGARAKVYGAQCYFESFPASDAHTIGDDSDPTKQSLMFSAKWLVDIGR